MVASHQTYLKTFYELSSECILFFDPDGNYVGANPAACQTLEYSLEELLQLSAYQLIPKHIPTDLIKSLFEKFFIELSPVEGEIELAAKSQKIIKATFKAFPNVIDDISALVWRRENADPAKMDLHKLSLIHI